MQSSYKLSERSIPINGQPYVSAGLSQTQLPINRDCADGVYRVWGALENTVSWGLWGRIFMRNFVLPFKGTSE